MFSYKYFGFPSQDHAPGLSRYSKGVVSKGQTCEAWDFPMKQIFSLKMAELRNKMTLPSQVQARSPTSTTARSEVADGPPASIREAAVQSSTHVPTIQTVFICSYCKTRQLRIPAFHLRAFIPLDIARKGFNIRTNGINLMFPLIL